MAGGREFAAYLFEQLLVLGNHFSLAAALRSAPEDVPGSAAKCLALGKEAKYRRHPGPQFDLARMAGGFVFPKPSQNWWGKVIFYAANAVEVGC